MIFSLIVLALLVWFAFIMIGLFVKTLVWLAIVGLVLFVLTAAAAVAHVSRRR